MSVTSATLLERLRDPRDAHAWARLDRKSTRLNSSHQITPYPLFCLKKKKREASSRRHLGALHGRLGVVCPARRHHLSRRHQQVRRPPSRESPAFLLAPSQGAAMPPQ